MFYTDSLAMCYAKLDAAKQWWVKTLDCKQSKLPDLDDPLPSDVALKLPGCDEPTILLSDRAEVEQAGFERTIEHVIIFTSKLKKAHEYLRDRGAAPGAIQDSGGTQFFEIRDSEGNVIEICLEP